MMEIYRAVIAARNNVSRAFNGPIAEMDGIIYDVKKSLSCFTVWYNRVL